MGWACRFEEAPELVEAADMQLAVDWLLSEGARDPASASLELSRLQASGQRFMSNPGGIKGFVKRGVLAPFGSPFETSTPQWLKVLGLSAPSQTEVPNSWHGDEYERSLAEEAFMADPSVQRRATVRIDEIMSFEYMQYVGDAMQNCLRIERRGGSSLMKYLSRVRSRESSYWVMTITAEGDGEAEEASEAALDVQHLLLVEVYNDMKVIHQAEGPHPRRWPRPDAWAWLREWAEQER
eukprot:CAMPEP_0180578436 /NCGR_PEP_ID=MMETSP1037_2-20121125/12462_1 /TAXON_ID=632150 /ORGANISM="Azadinium spinosum, Strain 3D9" /LENGTH=237 /DNA_ID=CAMNT_0022596241 /DNA_START=17 /DNA_END=727 /DNA_ORIENTATION=+